MARTKYAYVPFNRGATIDTDAVWAGIRQSPAGRLLVTVNGKEPTESHADTLDGRYAQRITRRTAERFFGREFLEHALGYALETDS